MCYSETPLITQMTRWCGDPKQAYAQQTCPARACGRRFTPDLHFGTALRVHLVPYAVNCAGAQVTLLFVTCQFRVFGSTIP
jgi:hypothetical protein